MEMSFTSLPTLLGFFPPLRLFFPLLELASVKSVSCELDSLKNDVSRGWFLLPVEFFCGVILSLVVDIGAPSKLSGFFLALVFLGFSALNFFSRVDMVPYAVSRSCRFNGSERYLAFPLPRLLSAPPRIPPKVVL